MTEQLPTVESLGRTLLDWVGEGRAAHQGDDLAQRISELLRVANLAQSRYRGLFDAAPDAITVIARDGSLRDANPAACRMYGWSIEEMLSKTVFDLNPTLPPDHMEQVWERIGIDSSTVVETTNTRRDGLRIPVEVHSRGYIENGQKLVVAVARNISERKRIEEHLRRQAQVDPLTGLLNRDAILASLSAVLADTDGHAGPALLYVDLDRFKVVNDLVGHADGDRLLIAAARRIAAALPGDTQVARFGGDQFLVLLRDASSDEEVWELADRIRDSFAQAFHQGGEEFVITASIGIARFPNDGLNAQQLLNHADVAMSEAKRRGRNGWQMFSPALALQLKEQLLIETQLRRAIENDEFHLVYQPVIDMHEHRVIGAEALLRWRSRVLGELPPDVFIPIAETSGDIVRIGAWVLRQACQQLQRWRQAGLSIDHVAVNVSFRQFLGENFDRHVAEALSLAGLPASALELEMTERALIEDAPSTEQTLLALRELGVAIRIDDFGEGYSALGYLRRLPISGIKLSHHFMQGVPANPTGARLCQAILQMAQALRLGVIVEGVETLEQQEFLLSHGARCAQGFLFSRPLPGEAFERYLRGA